MIKAYILTESGKPQACENMLQWSSWFETHDKTLRYTNVTDDVGVSTVFLGLDHNFSGKGEPLLWETMIFGGPHNDYQKRYSSQADAIKGHARAVKIARGEISE